VKWSFLRFIFCGFTIPSFQFLDCLQYLSHLMRLCVAFLVLDIYARIAGPGSLENSMTAAALPGLTKAFDA